MAGFVQSPLTLFLETTMKHQWDHSVQRWLHIPGINPGMISAREAVRPNAQTPEDIPCSLAGSSLTGEEVFDAGV